jgi:hypothetical protein
MAHHAVWLVQSAWHGMVGEMIRQHNGTVFKVGDRYPQHARSDSGPCNICRKVGPRVVDHCHLHGVIRGELCRKCNGGGAPAMLFNNYAKKCSECAELLRTWPYGLYVSRS